MNNMIEFLLVIFALSILIVFVFYLFVYPLFRGLACKIGDCYEVNYKDANPFTNKRKVKEQFIITGKQNGYIKYDIIEFYITSDGYEFTQQYSHSDKAYSHFMVYGQFKKIKK
jgi:hypothetical protein